jgi:cytochrome c oxidase subunit 2
MWDFELIPEQASTIAHQVDNVYFVLLALSAIVILGVGGTLLYFAVKYRHGASADRSSPVSSNTTLEVTWMAVPLVLSIGMFIWAAATYFDIKEMPREEALEIRVIGKQWMWKLQHPNGAREINTLHVPVNRPVKITMTSQDVIHSFFVPAFRVKQDVLPGRYVSAWFEATETGKYHLFCAEYCGTSHSDMEGYIHVMKQAEYQEWLDEGTAGDVPTEPRSGRAERTPSGAQAQPGQQPQQPAERATDAVSAGRALFQDLQCNACHRVDSTALRPRTGPVLEGLYGSTITLDNGRELVVDEQYLRESILYPQNKIAQGYPSVMPSFKGRISEDELFQLIAYLKSLSSDPGSQSSE